MKSISKILMIIPLLVGIILILYLLFNDTLHITVSLNSCRKDSNYTIITMITSPDFNNYPYTLLESKYRILPLIGTLILIPTTVLSLFYKKDKCIIASIILTFTMIIIFYIAYTGLNCLQTIKEQNLFLCSRFDLIITIAIASICYFTMIANITYKMENGLIKPRKRKE